MEGEFFDNDVTKKIYSKWLLHDSHLCSDWLILFLSKFQHGEIKVTPCKVEKDDRRWVRMRVGGASQSQPQRPLTPVDPQLQYRKPLHTKMK